VAVVKAGHRHPPLTFARGPGRGQTGAVPRTGAERGPFPRLTAPLTVTEARALPPSLEAAVEPRFIDVMGHMNVSYYVHLFDRATWALFTALGIDEVYRGENQAGMFAVEQHIRYLHELREGDALRIHSALLDVQAKSVHILHAMIDPARDRLAATTEVIGVHIDLRTRRAAAFPEAMVPVLRARVLGRDQRAQ
jgi:acyl-CoA thioester hydrolase